MAKQLVVNDLVPGVKKLQVKRPLTTTEAEILRLASIGKGNTPVAVVINGAKTTNQS